MKKVLLFIIALSISFCGNKEDASFAALKLKAKGGDQASRKEIVRLLKEDKESSIRKFAAEAIGELIIKEGDSQLVASFEADDDNVREAVIYSIGKLGDTGNFKLVEAAWKDEKEKMAIRKKALEGIGHFQSKEAVGVLKEALKDKEPQIRIIAIDALGDTASQEAAEELIKIIQNPEEGEAFFAHKKIFEKSAALSLAKLKQKSSYNLIIGILEKKIKDYEYDEVFQILVTLLAKEKYTKAEHIFAQAYLSSPSSDANFKTLLLKSFKELGLQNSYCVITGDVLNIREKSNTRANVIGSITAGELARVIEKTNIKYRVDPLEDYWYKIETPSKKQGWVFGGYLKFLDHTNLPSIEEKK